MDYTAQGHAVGLAQRMEQLASPGTVYVAEGTAKLVGGYFALRDLGGFRIKGSDDPVSVYELEGLGELKSRLDMSRARGLTRFVGRAREMAALETALERSLTGHGQVVGVVAEAGSRQEPALLRVCRELPCTRHLRLRGALSTPRQDHPLSSCPRGLARLFRSQRPRQQASGAREGRRTATASRP